ATRAYTNRASANRGLSVAWGYSFFWKGPRRARKGAVLTRLLGSAGPEKKFGQSPRKILHFLALVGTTARIRRTVPAVPQMLRLGGQGKKCGKGKDQWE